MTHDSDIVLHHFGSPEFAAGTSAGYFPGQSARHGATGATGYRPACRPAATASAPRNSGWPPMQPAAVRILETTRRLWREPVAARNR